jgi:hypothetical protein
MQGYQTDADGFFAGEVTLQPNPRPDPLIPDDDYLKPRGVVLVAPPAAEAGKRRRWTGTAWEQVTVNPGTPAPPPMTPEEELALERETWAPWKRAFCAALKMFPYPPALHMLDGLMAALAARRAADPYDDLVLWFDTVTIVLRTHPDMEAFRLAFSIPEPVFDLIFLAAIRLEAGHSAEDVQAWVDEELEELA